MRMKRDFGQRLLAALLVLCTLMTYLPVNSVSASGAEDPAADPTVPPVVESDKDVFYDHVKIFCEGQEIANKELTPDQHVLLTALYDGDDTNATYTWQIYSPATAQWVRIGGKETAELQVGYALLAGMLNEKGVALINCKVDDGKALYYSNTVKLSVTEPAEEQPQAAPMALETAATEAGGPVVLADDATSGGELVTYTVTVEYIDYLKYREDPTNPDHYKVRSDYVATVKANNEALNLRPDCPTVVGYTSCIMTVDGQVNSEKVPENEGNVIYRDGTVTYYGIPKLELELNLDRVTSDMTYQVFYFPTKVSYTVSHYIQNVNNDGYTLHYVELLTGYVNTMTEARDLTQVDPSDLALGQVSLKDQGFVALVPFVNEPIAVDGTTQIEAYYDRAYFLMTFKLNDGYGTEPVYARADTPISVEEPKRQGYEFVGWLTLLMENATSDSSSPRPATGDSVKYASTGGYIPIYVSGTDGVWKVETDASGQPRNLVEIGGKWYVEDTLDTNGKPTTDSITVAQPWRPNDAVPDTMPSYHSAYRAVWKEADATYNVIYWLEKADYLPADKVTNSTVVDGAGVQYDYWHSVEMADQKTGTNLTDLNGNRRVDEADRALIDKLENPLKSGAIKDDPEFNYYYYNFSDLRDGEGYEVKDVVVDGDGTTTVNVYFRRREYNLRFFYARSKPTTGTTTQYQVAGGSTYGFSVYDNTTTGGLLNSIQQYATSRGVSTWGDVTSLPKLTNPKKADGSGYYYTEGTYQLNDYTYHYFTMTARYGQNIAKEWPSDVMGNTTLKNNPVETKNGGWSQKTVVFSAWNGEYWLKYSKDQRDKGENAANYTIKGNYQQLDENLLYDPSFNDVHKATETDTVGPYGAYYERGTGGRYLDFIAFFENGEHTVEWSVPRQYHYYLWTVYDGVLTEEEKAAALRPVSGTMTENQALPQGQADFENMVMKSEDALGTLAYVNGKYYVLYDKVDCCDNSTNPSHQTVPSIPGYQHIDQYFANQDDGYMDYSTLANYYGDDNPYTTPSFAYKNTDWDENVYLRAFSIHFIYEPINYTITLNNHNHTVDIPTDYGSMSGANQIRNQYWEEAMEGAEYPADLMEGAYLFGGWYKSPDCLPGTEADLTIGMPNYNIMLYARWVPRNFTVQVYQTSERNNLVYYADKDSGGQIVPMEKVALQETVMNINFPNAALDLPVANTGKSYGDYLHKAVSAAGPDLTKKEDGSDYTVPENLKDIDPEWVFVCWAYMDSDGVEHAIDVSSFQVTEDVQLYAKWTATNVINYEIRYQLADIVVQMDADNKALFYMPDGKTELFWHDGALCTKTNGSDGTEVYTPYEVQAEKDENGDPITIADPLTGRRNEGVNRTFYAKTDLELYDANHESNTTGVNYQEKYFPLYASHTLMMRYGDEYADGVEAGADAEHPLVQTFLYVYMEKVPYTVQYLDSYGSKLLDQLDALSEKIVVTENYKYVQYYTPDAFQKTKILSANPEENVIVFNYAQEDDTVPYTIIYYQETLDTTANSVLYDNKKYVEYMTESGMADKGTDGTLLGVAYRQIKGYEYFADTVTQYVLNNDTLTAGDPTENKRGIQTITLDSPLALKDIRGDTAQLQIEDGKAVIVCTGSDKALHNHTMENSVFYFTHEGAEYELRGAEVVSGKLEVTGYYDPTGSFQVELGNYGAVIRVYYDLKSYPYFIYHEAKGSQDEENNTVLAVDLGKAKLGEQVTGKAWDDSRLIEKNYPGYTVDKTESDMTITITIEDDLEKPRINTMTFYYHERFMEYRYEIRLEKHSGESSTIEALNDPNAKLYVSSDPLNAVTGVADMTYPVLNTSAYSFAGWYLDEACTKPVLESDYAHYLQNASGDPATKTTGATADQLKAYEKLLPQKLTKFKYQDENGNAKEMTLTDASAFYAGAFNEATYTYATEQTFYAKLVPEVGELTIKRTNIGIDKGHNEANSFVYTVRGTTSANESITMQVTIGPGQDSVTISNLPFGTYTVTQENDWSWRYQDAAQGITMGRDQAYFEVEFDDDPVLDWLSGFAQAINTFKNNS